MVSGLPTTRASVGKPAVLKCCSARHHADGRLCCRRACTPGGQPWGLKSSSDTVGTHLRCRLAATDPVHSCRHCALARSTPLILVAPSMLECKFPEMFTCWGAASSMTKAPDTVQPSIQPRAPATPSENACERRRHVLRAANVSCSPGSPAGVQTRKCLKCNLEESEVSLGKLSDSGGHVLHCHTLTAGWGANEQFRVWTSC